MDESTLKDLMVRNCTQVFETMLQTSILEIPADHAPVPDKEERVVALIGFGGDHTGNCMITCSKFVACKVASTMLMEEYPALNEEVMDAFGEISNMVFGNVKTDLEEHLGPLRLSIPTVIVGEKFNIRNVSNPAWVVVKFNVYGGEHVDVRMCVTPSSSAPVAKPDTFMSRIPVAS
jgi:CheY-specific phosphatase CheX